MKSSKTQIAMFSAAAALTSAKAAGKNVVGNFDTACVKESITNYGSAVVVENRDLRYTIKFNRFGIVIAEQLEAFTKLLGFFPSSFKVVYQQSYSYGAGYQMA